MYGGCTAVFLALTSSIGRKLLLPYRGLRGIHPKFLPLQIRLYFLYTSRYSDWTHFLQSIYVIFPYHYLNHICVDQILSTLKMVYILITNLMHWLLFVHKILFSSTCFEPQVLIFRRIQLYTCSIWYCHALWEFVVACRYTAWVRTDCRGKVVGRAS